MSEQTSIEWADSSWNPIRGQNARHTCARISPGCDNCYAATMTRRGFGGTAPIDYGVGETPNDPARLDETALAQPLRWKTARKVFVCSMTDLFGTWVPDEWIDRIFGVMAAAHGHTFQVLTKRPSRMAAYLTALPERGVPVMVRTGVNGRGPLILERARHPEFVGWPLPNVWVGTSIETDAYVWRANVLREIPAAVRWISAEPLLGGLPSLSLAGIDWLVAGGESGAKARPSHPDWYRDLRDRCQASGTAFFMKQWGEWGPDRPGGVAPGGLAGRLKVFKPDGTPYSGRGHDWNEPGMTSMYRVGKHRSGRDLDGRTWDEFPAPALPAGGAT